MAPGYSDLRWIGQGGAVAIAVATWGIVPATGQCHPKFGEEIYEWVNTQVPAQSRRLAAADYEARTLNFFLIAGEDLNARITAAGENLDRIDRLIATSESETGADPDLAALRRDESATRLLNDLYRVRTELDEIGRRRGNLNEAPRLGAFQLAGLHNVGRATLFASLQDLGDLRQPSLSGRYSLYVSTTFDENGELQDGDVQVAPPDMIDAIVSAAAQHAAQAGVISGPYAIVIVVVYRFGRFAWDDSTCRRRLARQEERWIEALRLLPHRLIALDEQFRLYVDAHSAARKRFTAYLPSLDSAVAVLEERWREVFAYNATRQQAAGAVLTTARVNELRRQYEQGGTVQHLFDQLALIEVARDVGRVNSYLALRQAHLLSVCGNLDGYVSTEDQRDALDYATASFSTFKARPEFAPLHGVLETSLTSAEAARREVAEIVTGLPGNACASAPASRATETLAQAAATASEWGTRIVNARVEREASQVSALQSVMSSRSVRRRIPAERPSLPPLPGHCLLYRNGTVYFCGGGGSAGSPYGDEFGDVAGDPRLDVLGGARDGGYAADNRRVSEEIREVSRNVEARIDNVRTRSSSVIAVLPQWVEGNRTFLVRRAQAGEDARSATQAARTAFSAAHAAEVSAAKEEIQRFLLSPVDPRITRELVDQVGGTALQLPSLRSDAVVPGMPTLSGIDAARRVYGETSDPLRMSIARERLKASALPPGPAASAAAALSAAERFADTNPRIAGDLLLDARALRYWATGVRGVLDVTVVAEDGTMTRRAVENADALPADALLSRIRSMDQSLAVFNQRHTAVLAAVEQGSPTSDQVRAVRRAATMADAAERSFFSGDLIDGERILKLASAVLDVVTSLTPGISWGRDVYEAVTGRDLFSDEQLGLAVRTGAVIGAMSGGIGDKPLDVLRALRKLRGLDVADEAAETIVTAARTADIGNVKIKHHVLEQATDRRIDDALIDDAINAGARWWDVEDKSLMLVNDELLDVMRVPGPIQNRVVIEGEVADGVARVIVALKPENLEATTVYLERRSLDRITTRDGRKRFHHLGLDP